MLDEDQGKPYLDRYGQDARRRLVQLRRQRRAFHRPGQCREPQGRRPRQSRQRAARVARRRPQGPLGGSSRSSSSRTSRCGRLSGMGMGHRRWRAGPWLPQALRLGDRAQRSHSSGHAEGRGQRDLSHRALDRVPAARAWHGAVARPDKVAATNCAACSGSPASRSSRTSSVSPSSTRQFRSEYGHDDDQSPDETARGRRPAAYFHAAAPASAEEIAVKIGNFAFGPQELKVKAGTTVTWTNEDDVPIRSCRRARSTPKCSIPTGSTHSPSRRRAPTNISALYIRT